MPELVGSTELTSYAGTARTDNRIARSAALMATLLGLV
jgi:hypothetical protein